MAKIVRHKLWDPCHVAYYNKVSAAFCAPGKLLTLSAILSSAINEGSKVVVVSTSTTALNLIDNLLCGPQRSGFKHV